MQLELGIPVTCTDGTTAELGDVVVDPVARRVTHLVVEPHHRHALARLVPLELARSEDDGGSLALSCTGEELHRMAPVQQSAYLGLAELPAKDPDSDIGVQDVFPAPGGVGYAELGFSDPDPRVFVSYDRVPKGEVEVRRKSAVTSTDGRHLGYVEALRVDASGRITDVVLRHGHLWARREQTIPIEAIARLETDKVELDVDKYAADRLTA